MDPAPAKRRNVIFILSDDHRYDALGFLKAQPWLETPQLDRIAAEGAYFKNAFVTTALCSPSRASIFINLIPVFGILLATTLLGEKLHAYHIIGGLLVISGLILAAGPGSRQRKSTVSG